MGGRAPQRAVGVSHNTTNSQVLGYSRTTRGTMQISCEPILTLLKKCVTEHDSRWLLTAKGSQNTITLESALGRSSLETWFSNEPRSPNPRKEASCHPTRKGLTRSPIPSIAEHTGSNWTGNNSLACGMQTISADITSNVY